jgi:hypothetical protein
VGRYTLSALNAWGVRNDDITSLKVASGYQVTLYADDNFGGASLTKTADDASLVDDDWNDKVSSLVVSQGTSTPGTLIQAEAYSSMSGVSTEATSNSGAGSNVSYIIRRTGWRTTASRSPPPARTGWSTASPARPVGACPWT